MTPAFASCLRLTATGAKGVATARPRLADWAGPAASPAWPAGPVRATAGAGIGAGAIGAAGPAGLAGLTAAGLLLSWGVACTAGPDAWARHRAPAVLRRGAGNRRWLALTFDDGPDPRYTPRILDLLHQHRAPATFFVVGRHARRWPELVRRIVAEGHELGNHTMHHRHAYACGPARTRAEVGEATEAIRQAFAPGAAPALRWFRPPWGAFNRWLLGEALRLGQRPVLWSIASGDWMGQAPRVIARRVLDRLQPGAILVMHDAGGARGAPQSTLAALPGILEEARARGFEWVALRQLAAGVDAGGSGGDPGDGAASALTH